MIKRIKIVGILLITVLLVSCSTINRSHKAPGIDIQIKSPMTAKINVDMTQKLTGYASAVYLFHLFKISGDTKFADGIEYNRQRPGWWSRVDAVKAAAAYNAVRKSTSDVLVSPQYVLEESNWNPFYKQIKVKVTGYSGDIVSIRND